MRLRVVIADDESAARRFIKRLLSTVGLEVEVVGEASNGQELLSLLAHETPDVILLDILMPGMSGLDTLRMMGERSSGTKIVVVSAHDRFEFAKEALSLGVFDYLLKPVKQEELREVLERCAKQIRDEIEQQLSVSSKLKKAQITGEMAKSLFLRDYLAGNPSCLGDMALWNHLELLDLEMPRAMIAADVPANFLDKVQNEVSAWADAHGSVWCIEGDGRIIVLPSWNAEDKPVGLGPLAAEFHLLLRTLLPDAGLRDVRVAFVGPLSSGTDLRLQYDAVQRALNRAYVTGETLISASTERCDERTDSHSLFSLESKLAAEVRSGSPRTALELLRDLVEEAARLPATGREFLKLELAAVISMACGVASEMVKDTSRLTGLRNASLKRLIRAGSTSEMVQAAGDCLETVFEYVESRESSAGRTVAAAKAIVEERASEEITLSEVASSVFVSPFYLSRLFRQECGMSFQEYLTQVRISKAKALLRSTDIPCRVVGQAVGYSSASYFSQVFKKHTGLSPAEFRNSIQAL